MRTAPGVALGAGTVHEWTPGGGNPGAWYDGSRAAFSRARSLFRAADYSARTISSSTVCAARLQTLDGGAPVSIYTVSRELGHTSPAMVQRVYVGL